MFCICLLNPTELKGAVSISQTSLYKCLRRNVKRWNFEQCLSSLSSFKDLKDELVILSSLFLDSLVWIVRHVFTQLSSKCL